MNLSSLSGESLAAILPPNADYNLYSLSSAGVVVNFTGKGLFSFFSTSNDNIIRMTVDDVQFADMTFSELANGVGMATASDRFAFKSSLKVEIIAYDAGGVTVGILGA